LFEYVFDPDRDYLFALCLAPRMGGAAITRVIERNQMLGRPPQQFFSMPSSALQDEYDLNPEAAEALAFGAQKLRDVLEHFSRRSQGRLSVLTPDSPMYPARIQQFISAPPAFLFVYGNLAVLKQKTFSVACSRNPNDETLRNLEQAVEQGVLNGELLVTGANTHSYRRGAVVPLRWGSPRILVLDRGMFAALGDDLNEEPFRAARLWRYNFDPDVDLVLSPLRPDAKYLPAANQTRDELVFALSDRVEVVFASESGNTRRPADRMQAVGRLVEWR
jgi:DNA processing protein